MNFNDNDISLTTEEMEILVRDARRRNVLPPPRIKWDECQPTEPTLLQELKFVPPPTPPGPDATREQIETAEYKTELWHQRDMKRRTRLAELGNQRRTQ